MTTTLLWLLFVVLLGVVLGTVVSKVITYLVRKAADERRFRHERETEARERRREAYTAYLAACDRVYYEPTEASVSEFRRAFAGVGLVSSSVAVQNTANELRKFILDQRPQMGEGNSGDRDRTYGTLLRSFLNAAQRDLGVVPLELGGEAER